MLDFGRYPRRSIRAHVFRPGLGLDDGRRVGLESAGCGVGFRGQRLRQDHHATGERRVDGPRLGRWPRPPNYVAWMRTTAVQAEQAAVSARAAAGAYEAAFAATVPPPLIEANRAQLVQAVSTNVLGQNTPLIVQLETQYAEMWAQDATAMYGYAGQAAPVTQVTPFTRPAETTNPAGEAMQAASVAQAAGTSAGAESAQSQLLSSVPPTLQALVARGGEHGTAADHRRAGTEPRVRHVGRIRQPCPEHPRDDVSRYRDVDPLPIALKGFGSRSQGRQ